MLGHLSVSLVADGQIVGDTDDETAVRVTAACLAGIRRRTTRIAAAEGEVLQAIASGETVDLDVVRP